MYTSSFVEWCYRVLLKASRKNSINDENKKATYKFYDFSLYLGIQINIIFDKIHRKDNPVFLWTRTLLLPFSLLTNHILSIKLVVCFKFYYQINRSGKFLSLDVDIINFWKLSPLKSGSIRQNNKTYGHSWRIATCIFKQMCACIQIWILLFT